MKTAAMVAPLALPVPMTRAQFTAALVAWINRKLAPPGVVVEAQTPLFERGLIDSLQMLHLIAFTEQALGLEIPDSELRMDKFRTAARIAEAFGPVAQ
jgi:acyl carrier protein